jgi:hypothetical protein
VSHPDQFVVVCLSVPGSIDTAPRDRAFLRLHQSGHDPQKAGFTAAVSPFDEEKVPGGDPEIEVAEQRPIATDEGETVAPQFRPYAFWPCLAHH